MLSRNGSHLSAVPAGENHVPVVELLRQEISDADLDCNCRAAAHEMLDRVDAEDQRLSRDRQLAQARRMRDAIVNVLKLLDELDELGPDEPDLSAFDEVAELFQDLADFADLGSIAARRAGGKGLADGRI